MTKFDHIERGRRLKLADKHIRAVRGCNTELGVAALWGVSPRIGARWSEEESDELLRQFYLLHTRTMSSSTKKKLNATDMATLAWNFGRTASAINEQLYKLLGWRDYFERIEI